MACRVHGGKGRKLSPQRLHGRHGDRLLGWGSLPTGPLCRDDYQRYHPEKQRNGFSPSIKKDKYFLCFQNVKNLVKIKPPKHFPNVQKRQSPSSTQDKFQSAAERFHVQEAKRRSRRGKSAGLRPGLPALLSPLLHISETI